MTNQIHQWAHMPAPPRRSRVFRRRTPAAAARARRHHGRPYDARYCITTGWCNRPLEAIGFFRRLEARHATHRGDARARRRSMTSDPLHRRAPSRARATRGWLTPRDAPRRAHVALQTTEPTSIGGFISGLVSAILGIAGLGLVLCLRFPEYLMYGELQPLYSLSVPARRHPRHAGHVVPPRRSAPFCARTRRWR